MSDKEEVTQVEATTKNQRGNNPIIAPVDELAVACSTAVKTSKPTIQTNSDVTVNPSVVLDLGLENYKFAITNLTDLAQIAKTQMGFLRLLRGILNNSNQEVVNAQWNKVLNFANKNASKGFNEFNLFKGAASWQGSVNEFNILRHLNWLIIQTADPKTRKANMVGIKLDLILSNLNETEKNSLINFYG